MKQKTVQQHISATKTKMKKLGVYRTEYDESIRIYATLLYQYDIQYAEYEDSGFRTEIEFTNGNGIETSRPNPLIKILESLRKDIKTYADALCLHPKANNIRASTKPSAPNQDTGSTSKIAVLSKYASRRA